MMKRARAARAADKRACRFALMIFARRRDRLCRNGAVQAINSPV